MSLPGTFVRARIAELPTCLDGPTGQGCADAMGQVQDAEQALLTDAVLMRYPRRTPNDALDILGANSGPLTRFPNEKDGTAIPPTGYHGRLTARWQIARKKGSEQGIIDSLHAFGIPDVIVTQDFEAVIWPGQWYSRFRVKIGPDFGGYAWTGPTIDGTLIIDETVIGTTATLDEIKSIKLQILEIKAAHSYPVDLVFDFGLDGFSVLPIGHLIDVDFIIDSTTIGGYEV